MHLVLFDGVCGLCDRTVKFLLRNDRRDAFRFAPLQSALAREKLAPFGIDSSELDTVVVVRDYDTNDARPLVRARAVLFAVSELGGVFSLARLLLVVPPFLLDPFYRLVAKTRYRLFGKIDACLVPSAHDRAKFLAIMSDEAT